MNVDVSEVLLLDLANDNNNLLKEVLTGLSKSQKTIHPKYLYDKKGSEIFEKICHVPDYYPTRAEKNILKKYAKEMAEIIGPEALVIEPGSGSGEKVRDLLHALEKPTGYVPLEIAKDILLRMTGELISEFPDLDIHPICADFTQDIELPDLVLNKTEKRVVFFPGSTIGNLHPDEAIHFLKKFRKMMGDDGGLLIGVDLKKDKEVFHRAYNDSLGVTAEFNLNLLNRINREADATFETDNFVHEAFYNEEKSRVEMHLRSKISQIVRVNHSIFRFREGETIHTENSYKYSVEEFCELCARARFKIQKVWKDDENLFCVYYFTKG